MRRLILLGLLSFGFIANLFAIGTVIVNESGDNFPTGWTGATGIWTQCDTDYRTSPYSLRLDNSGGWTWKAINLSSYDAASFSVYTYGIEFYFGYKIDTTFYSIYTSANGNPWFFSGEKNLPLTATEIGFGGGAAAVGHLFDDLVVTADKKPSLPWTGESGYTSDGVEPDYGNFATTFTWRIQYKDLDNDASSYVKVHILKGGSPISGNPFNMTFVSGSPITGSTFTYSRTLSQGSDYSYYFEASDGWLAANNTSTLNGPDVVGPFIKGYVRDPGGQGMGSVSLSLTGADNRTTVTNSSGYYEFLNLTYNGNFAVIPSSFSYYSFVPSSRTYSSLQTDQANQNFSRDNSTSSSSLSWTGEAGYENDGVGFLPSTSTVFFRIKYTDPENDAPKSGYPKLRVLSDGTELLNSPFTLTADSSSDLNYRDGKIYKCSVFDLDNSTFTYYFEAYDIWNASSSVPGTVAFLNSRPPSVPANSSPIAADGAYVTSSGVDLKWSAADPDGDAITYTLYLSPALSIYDIFRESSLSIIYVGANSSFVLDNLVPGKVYYWRIKAEDPFGASTYSPVFSFKTAILPPEKAFNYPNPFRPGRENTNIVFAMPEDGSVTITFYTEFGEKVFQTSMDNLVKGSNSYGYDGKDVNGKVLFNGTYICIIKKKYAGRETTDKCRLLVIK